RRALYAFLAEHGVAHEKCGKLVVAMDEAEAGRLVSLFRQAQANGVEGLSLLTGAEVERLEPGVRAVAALHSAETGIVDSHGLMLALLGEVEARGGLLALRTPMVAAGALRGGGFRISAGGVEPTEVTARRLVVAAGLGAQTAAAAIKDYPQSAIPALHMAKGVYFRLNLRSPFSRLIYPQPVPGGLGTHFTRDLSDRGRFGPDVEYVHSENYEVDPTRASQFYQAVRRYWPELPDGALEPDYAGIRPKIHGPGEPQLDFRIDGPEVHGMRSLTVLFGIESPGLTCSLAIGERIAQSA
ncbi:MAG: NAD(P)/FAD-dependent oxidoreductase, partial [Caulobacteraceae bacterium]